MSMLKTEKEKCDIKYYSVKGVSMSHRLLVEFIVMGGELRVGTLGT